MSNYPLWRNRPDLYRPLIIRWLNRQGVPAVELEDLSQDVLLSVVKHLPTFEHSGNRGAFRSWLRTIVCSRTTDYWRAADAGGQATGGSGATAALQQIADPESELNRQWDEEHDRASSASKAVGKTCCRTTGRPRGQAARPLKSPRRLAS